VKVSVAHVVNKQIAQTGDLVCLLGGDESASFASLLDPGKSDPVAVHRVDGSQGKRGDRSKEKESDRRQLLATGDSTPSAISNLLGLRMTLPICGAPWRLGPADCGAAGDAKAESSLQSVAEATSGNPPLPSRLAPNVGTVDAPAANHQPVHDENAAGTTLFPDCGNAELVEPSKGVAGKDQDATATKAIPPPNDQDMSFAVTQPSSVTPGVVQQSAGFVGNGVLAPVPQAEVGSGSVGISSVQRYAATENHGQKFDGGRPDPAINAGGQSSGLPAEIGRGQVGSSGPVQGVVDTASSSTPGGHSQGSGDDPHRGSPGAKEVTAGGHVPEPQAAQSSPLVTPGPGGSVHGHSALLTSNHPESIRESAPNPQPKELTSPRPEDAGTRLLGSAMRGDLRVGVHTEAFGRVTIQTNAQGGQLSAQLLLENAKESATLAAHLPAVEQKLVQQHGLATSVRLVGGFDGGAGSGSMGRDQSGAGRGAPERYHNEVAMRSGVIGHDSSNESLGLETVLSGRRYSDPSRLDVTA
jgi:hypothetical protein